MCLSGSRDALGGTPTLPIWQTCGFYSLGPVRTPVLLGLCCCGPVGTAELVDVLTCTKKGPRWSLMESIKSAKAHLSALVDRAASGEEVWLTVRGKPRARLCPLPASRPGCSRDHWLHRLQKERISGTRTRQSKAKEQAIWDEIRGD